MVLDPLTVVMVILMGSPERFNRLAAHTVIRVRVAALSNRQARVPSRLWIVCIDSRTLSAS